MKFLPLLAVMMFLAACQPAEQQVLQQNGECNTDADCARAGCSGTICEPASPNPTSTICEWKEEYACYNEVSCGCIQGTCAWSENEAYHRCVEEKRST